MVLLALLSPSGVPDLVAQSSAPDGLPLWEVRSGERSLHILGSVHALRSDAYPLDPMLYQVFDAARAMAFEVDLGLALEAAPRMMARGMFPSGDSLRGSLPAELYADLEEQAGGLGVPIQVLDRMKPWLVALTINSLALQQSGFEAQLGVDMHFYRRGLEQGKRVVALESIDDQIEVFDALGPEEQVALLRSALRDLGAERERMDTITRVWANGDVERLARMMNESIAEHPALMERMLYRRNRSWIPAIEALLQANEPAIVIVGLGHMVGDDSVIDLLSERGYEVHRVTPAVVH